jgi:hypothetical protein
MLEIVTFVHCCMCYGVHNVKHIGGPVLGKPPAILMVH